MNEQADNQIKAVLACLNSAAKADPEAVNALLCNRVPANQELSDHPLIPVDGTLVGGNAVGALGLVNGVLRAAHLPIVEAAWSDGVDAEWRHTFLGFQVAKVQPKSPYVEFFAYEEVAGTNLNPGELIPCVEAGGRACMIPDGAEIPRRAGGWGWDVWRVALYPTGKAEGGGRLSEEQRHPARSCAVIATDKEALKKMLCECIDGLAAQQKYIETLDKALTQEAKKITQTFDDHIHADPVRR